MRTTSTTMRTWALATAGTVLAVAALAGCSSAGGTSSGDSKSLTVQVQAGQEPLLNKWISGFEKENPGVTVKTQAVSQTAKTGSNIQVITSSTAPDVAIVPTNSEAYTKLTQGKQLADLTDVWSQAKLNSRYDSTLATALKTGGKPYVVSIDQNIYNIVWYNKSLFSKAGITAPSDHRLSSVSELTDIVGKLKSVGAQGLSIGPADDYQTSWMLDAFVPTTATKSELDSYLTSWQSKSDSLKSKYTAAPFVDALTQIQQLGKKGVFQTGYLGQTMAQSEANFIQGKTGMILDGGYSIANFQKGGAKFDFGWMLLPPVQSGKKVQVSLYNGDAYAIPQRAKNPTEAKKFLEYIMSVKGQSVLPTVAGLPSVTDVPQSALKSLSTQQQEQVADQKENGGQPGWTSIVPGSLGQQLVDPKLQAMLNGQGTPESIAQSVQSEFDTTH